jgi:dephospho-CoA kinase
MIVVGLTGGIGSGKTYVAGLFAELGIPVYSSDNRAKELMLSDPEIKKGLMDLFGQKVIENQQLNRKLIADAIFADKTLLEKINRLVHPRVQTDFENWCLKQSGSKIIMKEAAILIESGAYKKCDQVIVVTAPLEIRTKRIMQRDNLSYKEVALRIENQISDQERLKYAHFVIENNGLLDVKAKVNAIFTELLMMDND